MDDREPSHHARLAVRPALPARRRRVLLHLLRPRLEGRRRGARAGSEQLRGAVPTRWRRSTSATPRPTARFDERVGRAPSPSRIAAPSTKENVARVLPGGVARALHDDGADKFARLKQDLAARAALHPPAVLHLGAGRAHRRDHAILLDRLAAGVEVRIMYDWMGCISFKKDELKQLAAAGAEVSADVTDLAAHQLPQPPQDRRHRRRDRLHRRHEHGPGVHRRRQAVRHLARHAPALSPARPWPSCRSCSPSRWFEDEARGPPRTTEYMPAPDRTPSTDGVLDADRRPGRRGPLGRCAARAHGRDRAGRAQSLRIQSPYFVPDYSIYDAMINAALSGVDVRFMMTGMVGQASCPSGRRRRTTASSSRPARASTSTRPASSTPRRSSSTRPFGAVGTMNMDMRSLQAAQGAHGVGLRRRGGRGEWNGPSSATSSIAARSRRTDVGLGVGVGSASATPSRASSPLRSESRRGDARTSRAAGPDTSSSEAFVRDAGLRAQPPRSHGLGKGLVVPLVLVGVGIGEVGDRPVEGVARAR